MVKLFDPSFLQRKPGNESGRRSVPDTSESIQTDEQALAALGVDRVGPTMVAPE